MRDSVRSAFVAFTERFEGSVPFMYLDIKGLVTTAIGNLIDPIEASLNLPFMVGDHAATQQEILDEWHYVKSRQDLRMRGGMAFRDVTHLRLTPDGVSFIVMRKLDEVDRAMRKRFTKYEEWPADAQLGVLSMSWAMGSGFKFPAFEAAAKAQQFDVCATECYMQDADNPGLRPRNRANKVLFMNANAVVTGDMDRERLWYPEVTSPESMPDIPVTEHIDGLLDSGSKPKE